MSNFFKEFHEFAARGNAVHAIVGTAGAAFGERVDLWVDTGIATPMGLALRQVVVVNPPPRSEIRIGKIRALPKKPQ